MGCSRGSGATWGRFRLGGFERRTPLARLPQADGTDRSERSAQRWATQRPTRTRRRLRGGRTAMRAERAEDARDWLVPFLLLSMRGGGFRGEGLMGRLGGLGFGGGGPGGGFREPPR